MYNSSSFTTSCYIVHPFSLYVYLYGMEMNVFFIIHLWRKISRFY